MSGGTLSGSIDITSFGNSLSVSGGTLDANLTLGGGIHVINGSTIFNTGSINVS